MNHAAENDQFKLHFWTTDQERTVYIQRLRRVLTADPPPQRFGTHGPNNILNELHERTVPPISESSDNQQQMRLFSKNMEVCKYLYGIWLHVLERWQMPGDFNYHPLREH
jgi:hypothetical protein